MLSPFSFLRRGLSHIQGVPNKWQIRCCWLNQAQSPVTGFFSLIRLSLIKHSQVMFIVQFSPTALNFGYDSVLTVNFFRAPCMLPWIPNPFRTICIEARICHLPSDEHTSVGWRVGSTVAQRIIFLFREFANLPVRLLVHSGGIWLWAGLALQSFPLLTKHNCKRKYKYKHK